MECTIGDTGHYGYAGKSYTQSTNSLTSIKFILEFQDYPDEDSGTSFSLFALCVSTKYNLFQNLLILRMVLIIFLNHLTWKKVFILRIAKRIIIAIPMPEC